jgi:hypothetical protein
VIRTQGRVCTFKKKKSTKVTSTFPGMGFTLKTARNACGASIFLVVAWLCGVLNS